MRQGKSSIATSRSDSSITTVHRCGIIARQLQAKQGEQRFLEKDDHTASFLNFNGSALFVIYFEV